MSMSNERHYRSRTYNDLMTDPAYMPNKMQTMQMNTNDINYALMRKLAKVKRTKMKEQRNNQAQSYYGSNQKQRDHLTSSDGSVNSSVHDQFG